MSPALLNSALLGAAAATAAAFDLQIVHWNDVHARNSPASARGQQLCLDDPYTDTSCYGGHARIAALCKAAKKANPATLCVDAGDEMMGTSWDIVFGGEQTPPLLTAVGADVMATGNHEFDFGVKPLAKFIDALTIPMLGGCNMDVSEEPSLNIKKWHVFDVAGHKVALLGYIAQDTGDMTSAGKVKFLDPLTAVPACLEAFKASPESEGVKIIGLLSHAGVTMDTQMAEAMPEAAFIVSSHSHTPMFPKHEGPCLEVEDGACESRDDSEFGYPLMVAGTPILQQYYASKYAGVSTLTFSDSGQLTAVSGKSVALGTSYASGGADGGSGTTVMTVPEDPEVMEMLADKFEQIVEFSSDVIGALPKPEGLPSPYPAIRKRETGLGNTICDATLAALKANGLPEEPETPLVCLVNGGNIRAGLPPGDVTYGDVTAVLPFGNYLEVIEITGAKIKAALSYAYQQAHHTAHLPAKFLSVGGGLSVILDKPPPDDEAITTVSSAQYNCEDIQDDDVFHLAVNSYIGGGGDGFVMFADLPRVLAFGPTMADSLAEYIDANTPEGGVVPRDAIDIEGRIVDTKNVDKGVCAGVEGPVESVGTVVSSTRDDGRAPRPRPSGAGMERELQRRGLYDEFLAVQEELQQAVLGNLL